MQIDASSSVPVFQQIAELLRSQIGSGVYRSGELIPSVRQTAEQLLVNPNTVQRAYEILERDGLIQARKGMGMAVVEGAQTTAMNGAGQRLRDAFAEAIRPAVIGGISRTVVDRAYRQAWQVAQQDRSES